jgi:hypothetical protein
MAFWIGLAVLGFVVTVLIVESRPVRRRLERWSAGDGFWTGGDGGSYTGGGDCGGGWGGFDGGGGGGGDGGGGGGC